MTIKEIEEERERSNGAESVEIPIDRWNEILNELESIYNVKELLRKAKYESYDNEHIYYKLALLKGMDDSIMDLIDTDK